MATDAAIHEPLTALAAEFHPDISHLVTEDDAPVDSIFSELQMRLLVEALKNSWAGPGNDRPFVVMSNVGLFTSVYLPPVVPDVLLSVNVKLPDDLKPKKSRSYFSWEYGRVPDVVVEIVSNREGGEDSDKLIKYAEIGVRYYVVFDPYRYLSEEVLRVFRLHVYRYERMTEPIRFPEVALGMQLWQGKFEDATAMWLRWTDAQGTLIPTGKETADAERQRADAAEKIAAAERLRADRLAERLRQLGVDNGQ